MSDVERARVKVVLVLGDDAEVTADTADAATPVRYPAAEIADAVGVEVRALPGMKLTATVGPGDRLTGWERA